MPAIVDHPPSHIISSYGLAAEMVNHSNLNGNGNHSSANSDSTTSSASGSGGISDSISSLVKKGSNSSSPSANGTILTAAQRQQRAKQQRRVKFAQHVKETLIYEHGHNANGSAGGSSKQQASSAITASTAISTSTDVAPTRSSTTASGAPPRHRAASASSSTLAKLIATVTGSNSKKTTSFARKALFALAFALLSFLGWKLFAALLRRTASGARLLGGGSGVGAANAPQRRVVGSAVARKAVAANGGSRLLLKL